MGKDFADKFYITEPRTSPVDWKIREEDAKRHFQEFYAATTTTPPADLGIGIIDREKEKEKVELPKQWHVFILNDDFTPFQVVIWVIEEVFGFPRDEAIRRMQKAEREGKALMGTFSKDVAETKVEQVSQKTKEHGEFPLKAVAEEAP